MVRKRPGRRSSGWGFPIFCPVAAPKFYWVLKGEITVKTKTDQYKIGPNEGIFIGPNEGREIINETNMPVTMLVVINY